MPNLIGGRATADKSIEITVRYDTGYNSFVNWSQYLTLIFLDFILIYNEKPVDHQTFQKFNDNPTRLILFMTTLHYKTISMSFIHSDGADK